MGCFVSINDTTLGASLIGHTFKTKQSSCLSFYERKYLLGRTMFDISYKKVQPGFFSLELMESVEFNIISIERNGPHINISAEITNNIPVGSLGQLREYRPNGWTYIDFLRSTNMFLPAVSCGSLVTRGLIVTINAEMLGFVLPRVNGKLTYEESVRILPNELTQIL